MNEQTSISAPVVNGIDLGVVGAIAEAVVADPAAAEARFAVTTEWRGQCRSISRTRSMSIGGQQIERRHAIAADEPHEMLGGDEAPNPQELLLAALNACILVGFVTAAAAEGITLSHLSVDSEGALDLRGFLDPESGIAPGVDKLVTRVSIDGNGTDAQFEAILDHVRKVSPNHFHLTRPIPVECSVARG
ncbi:OsmC family protein [Sphingomicrobium arenosum]|uniref:OsmC family protein n=1 Tax=Sphingomicrobium arenosum TaxID=2233861 RepID=UPI00223EEF7C|nr:OsmC family protein [Sphingomicrobium arenosum]